MAILNKISLLFENCDTIAIDKENVGYLEIAGVYTTVMLYEGVDHEHLHAKFIQLNLSQQILDQKMEMGDGTLRERLENRDITAVTLCYKDGTEKKYLVPWPDDDDYTNKAMSLMETPNDMIIFFGERPAE